MLALKKLLCLNPCVFPVRTAFATSIQRLLSSSLHSTDSSGKSSSSNPHFVVEYLVKSCGLSLDKAAKASKHLIHLKSTSNADSVLQFLKQIGLTDANIRTVISYNPKFLCSSVDKTLKPRMIQLQETGLSASDIALLISLCPDSLRYRNMQNKIKFWMTFFGNTESLMKALKRGTYLLTRNLETVIQPNLSLLQNHCSLSIYDISKLLIKHPGIITTKHDVFKVNVQRAEALGIPRGSGNFKQALLISSSLSQIRFDAKIKLLKSLGWSEAEVSFMITRQPMLIGQSEETIRRKVDFLVREAGLELQFLVRNPFLISLSTERRLIPRQYVLKTLKNRGISRGTNFCSALQFNEKKFLEKFVLPYEDVVPGLSEAYAAACAGKVKKD